MTKLPDLYTNHFDKKIDNSLEYTKVSNIDDANVNNTKYEINKKIDNIFRSSSYIYKIRVRITLENKVLEEYLIGRNNVDLITINNELIHIRDVKNIEEI